MKPLTFAVIGAGYFGKNYLRLLRELPGACLKTVVIKTPESQVVAKKIVLTSVQVTSQLKSVLNDSEIDCVIVATPPSTHCAIATQLIESGKHILLEKPMTLNVAEARCLQRSLKKKPITFMVGHQYVYHDCMTYLHNQILKKNLGKIHYFFGEHLYLGPLRNDVGCLLDAGTHQLSILQYLLNPGNPKKVNAIGIDYSHTGREDFASVQLQFQKELVASFTVSWFAPEKKRNCLIAGDKKFAVFDDTASPGQKLKLYSQRYPSVFPFNSYFIPKPTHNFPIVPALTEHEPLQNELIHFMQCIRQDKKPRTGFDQSLQITQWLDAIQKAMA